MNEEHTHSVAGGTPAAVSARQWLLMKPFVLFGLVAIVAGGLVAAVTRPTDFEPGPWVSAYLVLVAGAAQLGLGVGQALLAVEPPSVRRRAWQLLTYNLANLTVLVATLGENPPGVVAGSVVLLGALVLFLTVGFRARTAQWPLVVYRVLIGLLALSIPIGVVLSVLRHG